MVNFSLFESISDIRIFSHYSTEIFLSPVNDLFLLFMYFYLELYLFHINWETLAYYQQ